MTQTTFPKNRDVCVTQREFRDLILALSLTITNHLSYVDDLDTLEQWNDLKCNGIDNKDNLTVVSVGRMLDMTDSNNIELGTVIPRLFEAIPILKHYWILAKTNKKSVYVRRTTTINMSTFLETMGRKQQKLKQTTLSQFDIAAGKKDEAAIQDTSSVDVKDDNVNPPSPSVSTDGTKGRANPTETVVASNVAKQTGDDDEGFTLATKTVPATLVAEKPSSVIKTSNAFASLSDMASSSDSQKASVVNEPENESDISFSSTSRGSPLKSAIAVVKETLTPTDSVNQIPSTQYSHAEIGAIVAAKLHDHLSIADLELWINNQVSMVLPTKSTMEATAKDILKNTMKGRIDYYTENEFETLIQKVKKTASDSQVNVMMSLNRTASDIYCDNSHKLHDMKKEVQQLKEDLQSEVKKYKKHLEDISAEWNIRNKTYLEEHLEHRRTVLTNQKASFDMDIQNTKDDFERYMAKLYATRTTMEDDVTQLQQLIVQQKAELATLRDSIQATTTASVPPPPVDYDNRSVASGRPPTPVNYDNRSTHSNRPPTPLPTDVPAADPVTSTPAPFHQPNHKPYSRGTKVCVNTGYLNIHEATVQSHCFTNDNKLYYYK